MKKLTIFAVMPCLNEEENTGGLGDILKHVNVTPIVVNDGRTDKTAEIPKNARAIMSLLCPKQNELILDDGSGNGNGEWRSITPTDNTYIHGIST